MILNNFELEETVFGRLTEDGIRTRDPLLGKELGVSAVRTSVDPQRNPHRYRLVTSDAYKQGVEDLLRPRLLFYRIRAA